MVAFHPPEGIFSKGIHQSILPWWLHSAAVPTAAQTATQSTCTPLRCCPRRRRRRSRSRSDRKSPEPNSFCSDPDGCTFCPVDRAESDPRTGWMRWGTPGSTLEPPSAADTSQTRRGTAEPPCPPARAACAAQTATHCRSPPVVGWAHPAEPHP